jgi:hypothetical protein
MVGADYKATGRAVSSGRRREKMAAIVRAVVLSFLGGLLLAGVAHSEAPPTESPRSVPRAAILKAMRLSGGYDLCATANGPRLQADVLRKLIREAGTSDPGRRPLLVGGRQWFEAFLDRTGLAPAEAPLYVRKAYEVGQDVVVDYRRERVIEEVVRGPAPLLAANVVISWPDGPGVPRSYSYDDRRASPHLRVTQERTIRYRLVDYGDRLWYADVSGLHGRPTSGPLGVLFDVIGEARVLESRSAFAADGVQVVRGRAEKFFLVRTATATVWPDGHAEQGTPRGRPDLRALESRLEQPLEIRFRPMEDPDAGT